VKKKILIFSLLFFWVGPAAAQELIFKKVAVFPFTILSKEPLTYLGERIQQSIRERLEKDGFGMVPAEGLNREISLLRQPLNEAAALEIGKKLGADVVLFGDLIKVGPTLAIESRLFDLTGKRVPATIKVEGVGLGALDQLSQKLAQEASFKILGQERIAKIEAKGNRRVDKDAILAAIQTREGDLTSPAKLRDDLKAVYNLGFFNDVKIDVSDTPQGRVLTFLVDEKPAIQDIIIQGNRKLKSDKIKEALDIKLYSVTSDAAIREKIDKVRGLYKEKGYYEVTVNYRLDPISKTDVNLVVDINEGGKIYVRKIGFEGNHSFKDKVLKDVMETKEKSLISFITGSGILKKDYLERDVEKVSGFYFNHGYIKAKVSEPKVDIRGNGIYITVPIEEGPQFKVGKIDFQGDLLESADILKGKLDIAKEKIYSRELVQKDMTTLSDLYADKGYANADISPLLKENDQDLTVDLTFDIRQGEKVSFERIEIVGNIKTRDKVVRRELRVYEQELFNATNIKRSTQNLRRLEFFEDVNFATSPGSSPDKINLKINVKERPTGSFGLGAGYSTQDKVVGMLEVSQSNLFGRGQQLKAQAMLGAISRRYRLSFTEPYLFDRPLSFGFDTYNWLREYDEYTRKSIGGDIRLSHPLRWEYQRVYFSYRYEYVKLDNLIWDPSPSLALAATLHTTSAVAVTWRRDSRDAVFTPSRGSDHSISIEQAGLGGQVAYTRFIAESGWYFPLKWGTVGVLHGRIGYMLHNSWGQLPVYEKFYLGGIDTIRGFKYADISPRDPNTWERLGGEKFVQINTEYRFPLFKKLGLTGLVFFDAGNVYPNNENYFNYLRTSIGAGVRWYSPMGPLRVEWGYNLKKKPWEKQSNWEFSVGGTF
jgi:outer membrane protein insertion porin family